MRARIAAVAAVLATTSAALPLTAPMDASAASACLSGLPQVQQVTTDGVRSLAGSTPVLFVHGINSGPGVWGPASPTSVSGQAAAIPGVTAWTYSYAHESLDWVSTQQIGPDLATAITCLAAISGHKVVVVGHSMGGLAAQYALGQDQGRVAADTAEVITIGTPYQGSVLLHDLQDLMTGTDVLRGIGGQAEEVVLAEALLSACAGIATSQMDSNPCWLVSVPKSPVGTALEEHSSEIAQLPPWPASVPVFDTAGDIEIRIGAGRISFAKDFGDVPVSLASATAHDTAGPPVIEYCGADRTLLSMTLLNPGPCFHTALPHNPAIVAAVLAAIRADSVTKLSLQLAPDPPAGPDVTTSGDYLQVAGPPGLGAVNTALRAVITDNEQAFMAGLRRRDFTPPPSVGPGVYNSQPDQGEISASSDVVSALIPVTSLLPGGNDGEVWASGTYLVPSAAPVSLQSLFASPSQGMAAMAGLARSAFTAKYSCISQAASSPYGDPYVPNWAPTAANYQYWAMTPAGLAIGFVNGQVSDEACGRMEATIPWSELHAYLSPLALQLIGELR